MMKTMIKKTLYSSLPKHALVHITRYHVHIKLLIKKSINITMTFTVSEINNNYKFTCTLK